MGKEAQMKLGEIVKSWAIRFLAYLVRKLKKIIHKKIQKNFNFHFKIQ